MLLADQQGQHLKCGVFLSHQQSIEGMVSVVPWPDLPRRCGDSLTINHYMQCLETSMDIIVLFILTLLKSHKIYR